MLEKKNPFETHQRQTKVIIMREAGILGRNEVQMKAGVLHYSPLKPSQISSSYWVKMGSKGSPGAPEGGASRLTAWRLS